MERKVIITAAVTGGDVTPTQAPYLPLTPKEIAEEAIRSAEAGAAIVHVHARDPKDGRPSSRLELFEEIFKRVNSETDVVICPTTGGSITMSREERLRLIPRFKPEMATFNMGTMNYATHFVVESYDRRGKTFRFDWEREYLTSTKDGVFRNTFADLEFILQLMNENDVKPECEVYDLGMLYNMAFFLNRGALRKPLQLQFVLGVVGGAQPEIPVLSFMKGVADEQFGKDDYTWSTVGVGYPQEFHLGAFSILLGGNIRVGMEDNLRVARDVYAKSNAEMVEKAVRIVHALDFEVATPEEARQILKLKGRDKVNF